MTQGVKTIAYRMVTLVVLTLGMAACAEIPALPPTVNTLDVLGPDQEFADAVAKRTLPPTWSLSGQVHPSALRIQSIDGLPALQVTPRHTRVRLDPQRPRAVVGAAIPQLVMARAGTEARQPSSAPDHRPRGPNQRKKAGLGGSSAPTIRRRLIV